MFNLLKSLGIPVAYGFHKEMVEPPFLVYLYGALETFKADNKIYDSEDTYSIEYYFKKKDREKEREIENLLTDNDYIYTKSEDVYIESEGLYVIYYEV